VLDFSEKEKPGSTLGVGLGLRSQHYQIVLDELPRVSWFEAISENFMGLSHQPLSGRPLAILERVRSHYPIVLHGVSLSIGSTDDLNLDYLSRLKELISRIEPEWVSDHLCWTSVEQENLHDLMPLPYTEEALAHLSERILRVQDFLKRPLTFENVSAYLEFEHSQMPEWEFLSELSRRTGCGLLVDLNNIFVSSVNMGFDPLDFMKALPKHKITQIHLAGHSVRGGLLIDTHDTPISDEVWLLFEKALSLWGPIPSLIERDDNIPDFNELHAEAARAEKYLTTYLKTDLEVRNARPELA
jgi:uncharacterized protein (UPF0276 family)